MKRVILLNLFLFSLVAAEAQLLKDLLDQAKQNYPLLKVKRYEVVARKEALGYAKSSAIPSLDAGYQVNYATYNNITGMATAQHFVPISGPPSATNSDNAVLGTAGGLLLNWDLLTFGQRKSKVESAKASLAHQEADEQNEIFQHQVRTASAYLDLMMTYQLVKVYQKNLERTADNLRIVRSLSASGLRPGVDTALFHAELSRARIDLLNYEKLRQTQQLQLTELLGINESDSIRADSSYFKRLPAWLDNTSSGIHPVLNLAAKRLKIAEQEKISLARSLYPKLSLWGTAYGRGSGIRYDGYVNSEDGLSFSRYNYGAGLILSVPLLQFIRAQYQIRAQESLIQAEQERENLTKLQLSKQAQLAQVTFKNALKIANESPAFYEAADYAYKGLLSRFNAGLVNYSDLIQAQYALVKAEADLKRAHIDAWKSLLYESAVIGDLDLFLNQL